MHRKYCFCHLQQLFFLLDQLVTKNQILNIKKTNVNKKLQLTLGVKMGQHFSKLKLFKNMFVQKVEVNYILLGSYLMYWSYKCLYPYFLDQPVRILFVNGGQFPNQ